MSTTDRKLEVIHLLAHGLSDTQNAEQTATYIDAINREWNALFLMQKETASTAPTVKAVNSENFNTPKDYNKPDGLSSFYYGQHVHTLDGKDGEIIGHESGGEYQYAVAFGDRWKAYRASELIPF
jgi:hypothetical protein